LRIGIANRLIQQAIHEVWRRIFNVSTTEDFTSYVPADGEVVNACNGRRGPGPGPDMRLYFGFGYSGCTWNRLILQEICNQIQALWNEHNGWDLPDVSVGYLMGELHGWLKRSQEAWARVQPCYLHQSGKMETPEQVVEHVQLYYKKPMADVGGRSLQK
jgi:hypothetical protein